MLDSAPVRTDGIGETAIPRGLREHSIRWKLLSIKLLYKPMASHYSKLSAIFLFALLQCFAPLLHAHYDVETHGLSGVHQHEAVELYCLDTEKAPCPEAKVEALDTQAVTTALAFPKKFPPPPDPADFWLWQSQARVSFVAIPLAGINIPRSPFVSPLAHAPPRIL